MGQTTRKVISLYLIEPWNKMISCGNIKFLVFNFVFFSPKIWFFRLSNLGITISLCSGYYVMWHAVRSNRVIIADRGVMSTVAVTVLCIAVLCWWTYSVTLHSLQVQNWVYVSVSVFMSVVWSWRLAWKAKHKMSFFSDFIQCVAYTANPILQALGIALLFCHI